MAIEFEASTERTAIRKAIEFWYNNLKDDIYFLDFLKICKLKEENDKFIVIYDGKITGFKVSK